jgi:PadR family transcriptional regulator, regulatory protein PadR
MVLLALLRDDEDYGYSIVVRLRETGFDGINEGTVYPALTRLESKGWLTSRLVASTSGPARKYYRTTGTGQAELARSDESWRYLVAAVDQALGDQALGDKSAKAAPNTSTKGDRSALR